MGWLPGYEDWRLAESAQLPDSVLLKSLQVVRSQPDVVQAVQETCEGAGSPDWAFVAASDYSIGGPVVDAERHSRIVAGGA